jgi:hypothetical protein
MKETDVNRFSSPQNLKIVLSFKRPLINAPTVAWRAYKGESLRSTGMNTY